MRWEKVLLDHDELRPIWRCLLSVVMILLAYLGIAIALGMVFGGVGRWPRLLGNLFWLNLCMLPALFGIFKIMTGFFDEKPLASVGVALRGRWRQELGLGLGLGAAMIFLVAGLERLLGLATFLWTTDSPQRVLAVGGFLFVLVLVAASNEELVFRGYPFQRLVDSVGPPAAVAAFSALFGLAHLANPSPTWVSTLNTMLIGVPLAVAYLRTRSLWMPIGMHFAWNFLEGYVLGLPVSGLAFPAAVAQAESHGAAWLTGGTYGPEGGLLTTQVIVAATVYLCFSERIYMSEETKQLLSGPTIPKQEPAASPAATRGLDDR